MWGHGDPAALAVSPDERTLYSAEGQGVRVYSLARFPLDRETELGWISVDAAIVHMAATDGRLYIAGGSQGVFAVDVSGETAPAEWPLRRVAARGASVATAVAVSEGHLWALFGARDRSLVCLFDAGTLELTAERELGPGTAWALATKGDTAYVAMGHGGLVRVRRDAEGLHVDAGPRGAAVFPPQRGFALEPGCVRDVALDGGRLYAAADAGLAEIDLAQDWRPDMPVQLHGFEAGGLPTYGRRVAARGGRVVFGSNAGPNELIDGAPYNAFGAMGRAVRLADIDPKAFVRGNAQQLFAAERVDGQLRLRTQLQPGGGWRGLVLGERRIYEQHLRVGLVVREWRDGRYELVHQGQPRGYPSAHGTFSASRPERLLFGVDSAGAQFEGFLAFDGEALRLLPLESAAPFTPGLMPGPPWRDEDPDVEWLLDGLGFDLRLVRLTHGEGVRAEHWIVPQPGAEQGRGGHTYFHSVHIGDMALVSRTGTSHGLVGYSRDALVAAARRTEPGKLLATEALFELETSAVLGPDHHVRSKRATKLALGERPDGRTLLALAAGFDAETDRSLVLLYELGRGAKAAPRPVAALWGDSAEGNAITAAFLRRGERLFLAVADVARGVQCYDVTDPEAPVVGAHWSPGPNEFDGRQDSLLDLVAEGARLHLAYGRLGWVTLDATSPAKALVPIGAVDTPGLAYGVALGHVDGRSYLALGDHQAGVRLYRLAGP
ncbi:MAG: hypothetical protein GC161_09190 [Planctomycetaceae bacterium]|nr:hypothetical protein [Planctomycetaceae bacterium]